VSVREATVEDVPRIFDLGQKMLNRMYGYGKVQANRTTGYREMRQLIQSKIGVVLVDEVDGELLGVLAGQVMKWSFVDLRYATDIAFFVEENHPVTAVKLLRTFIYWARQQPNVREVLVNVTHGLGDMERMKTMYEKLGMRHVGGSFSIRLGNLAEREAA
jgi:hypothetical protein